MKTDICTWCTRPIEITDRVHETSNGFIYHDDDSNPLKDCWRIVTSPDWGNRWGYSNERS